MPRRSAKPTPPGRLPLPFPPLPSDARLMKEQLLGGMVRQAMALAPEAARGKHSEAKIAAALREGAHAGFRHNLDRERERHEQRKAFLAHLDEAGPRKDTVRQ